MLCLFTLSACSSDTAKTSKTSTERSTQVIAETSATTSDATSGASADATTSASIVPEKLVKNFQPSGFTDKKEQKRAIFIVGDPRKDSVTFDLANTAMAYFEDKGLEVELRDLYEIKFNPVLSLETFYSAKDGAGETPKDVLIEQKLIDQADHIIFVYPNWHDTPTAIVKGYMERVFEKTYAYEDGKDGLDGLLKDKDMYTIMNCGFLGGGRGFIGDGVGIDDETWDKYMNAFKVFDDDTAQFWGVTNKGRFMNDRTPANESQDYEKEIEELRQALRKQLDKDFF